ncbi:MAG: DsrE family protein [Sedimenticola sp.]
MQTHSSTPYSAPLIKAILFGLLLLLPLTGLASQVDRIIAAAERPDGIVFEVVSGDEDALDRLLPVIREDIVRLRKRFPDLDIAVVSHGSEQFALMTEEVAAFRETHETVQRLVDDDVPVHVCGTHASWRGRDDQDFPAYVDVAPSGPAQINQYIELGFLHILVD